MAISPVQPPVPSSQQKRGNLAFRIFIFPSGIRAAPHRTQFNVLRQSQEELSISPDANPNHLGFKCGSIAPSESPATLARQSLAKQIVCIIDHVTANEALWRLSDEQPTNDQSIDG